MSYENTECPCGGRKERETMLCEQCQRELAARPEMATLQNEQLRTDARRHAAIILLALARRRGQLTVWKGADAR